MIIALGLFFCHPVFVGPCRLHPQCMRAFEGGTDFLKNWFTNELLLNCIHRSQPRSPQPLPSLRIQWLFLHDFVANFFKETFDSTFDGLNKHYAKKWKKQHMKVAARISIRADSKLLTWFWFTIHSQTSSCEKKFWVTLTQTNSSHLKMDGWKFLVSVWGLLGLLGS